MNISRNNATQQINPAESDLDFAELFRQYYPRIYNYLRYRVNSREDTEDLISLVFEKAFTHHQQFDAAKGAFSTWLFGIAHNTLANYYRTRQRRGVWESEEEVSEDLVKPDSSPEAQMIQQETIVQLLRSLSRLGERDQEVISLKFAGRLSNQEIGQIMNLPEKHVSVALFRAMRRLQQYAGEVA
ncbi:MAG: sigma-70 family RNA polymerase sigma factor [Chloroflexi bacterium]|nr:sigma-70 family RNA polymerase sigma factor [Chloroflexota bacterium]